MLRSSCLFELSEFGEELQLNQYPDLSKALEDYVRYFNAGDSEKVALYYANEAVIAPPVGPELHGRGAIQFYYRQTFREMSPQLSNYRPECHVMGDWVVVRETWSVTVGQSRSRQFTTSGKGLWLARKDPDKDWSTMRVVWSLARFDDPVPDWLGSD